MRILFLNWSRVEYSGGEKHLLALMRELKALGVDPLLLCPRESPLAEQATANGIAVQPTDLRFFDKANPVPHLRSLAAIDRTLRWFKPQVIHAQGVNSLHWLWPFAQWGQTPVAWQLQDYSITNRFSLWAARKAAVIIAASRAVGSAVTTRYGLNTSRCLTIYQGVECPPPAGRRVSQALRKRLGLKPGDVAVGICGRIHPKKGQHLFIQAAALLQKETGIRWFIAGDRRSADPGYLRELDALVQQPGLGTRVRFTGFISDMPVFLQAMDVITVPSQDEPLGLISVETQAQGRPVIVSNDGGLPETLFAGGSGLIMREYTPECLARNVRLLAKDKERRTRMGSTGKEMYRTRFTIRENALKILARYQVLACP